MSNNIKTVKKGDFIFKEGDKISSVVLIQSGSTQLCLTRNKKNIEVFTIGPSQLLGEQAFVGGTAHAFSLLANTETKYMEIPVEIAKAQLDASPQFLKILIRSLVDRLKSSLSDIKTTRMEKDASPCPEDQTAKVFASIYHAANKKAKAEDEKNPNVLTMDWVPFKQYCQRVFGESLKRLENAVNLLVKLKICSYTVGKPPDDPNGADEIQKVNFHDLPFIETFFEYYQYYYFKGSSAALLRFDESAFNWLTTFLKMAESLQPDRLGVVSFDMSAAIEHFKNELGIQLGQTHFTQLETKGVFAKRQSKADGSIVLSFELKEWQNIHKIWRFLREIEKWNEKGSVDPLEEEEKMKKKPVSESGPSCPQCSAAVAATAKFCGECGAKLTPAGQNGAPPPTQAA